MLVDYFQHTMILDALIPSHYLEETVCGLGLSQADNSDLFLCRLWDS